MSDQTLKCKDCGSEFVWTEGEQAFYKDRGFSAPLRCKDCRVKARSNFNNRQGGSGYRQDRRDNR